MVSTTPTVKGERANVSTTAFTIREASDDEEVISLSLLAIGLILEAGILAVAVGNLLVLLSLKFQKHWLITDILLLSLSAADFVGGAFALQIVIFMNYFLQQNWTAFNCGLYIVVANSLRFASAGTVTLMAIDRAFMILKPIKYRTTITTSKVKKLVVFTWVSAILFASLPFMEVGKSGYEDGKCFYHLTDLGDAYAILILTVSFLLLTSVLVCYFAIKSSGTKFIKRQTTMQNKSAGTDPTQPKERRKTNPSGVREIQRLSRMMAVVVFLYYISWLPMLISNIVTLATNRRSSKLVVLLTGMVSLIYALANPIIYGKMSMRYWWAYKRVFGAVCVVCEEKPRSWSISFSTKSTSRSRTLTNPQLPAKEQEFGIKNGIKNAGSENQTTTHGQTQVSGSEVHTSGVIKGSDDITDGVIVDFHSERDNKFNSEFTNRETDSSVLSNDLLL